MCTKRKSKWFPLVSIGLLITVFPLLIERISSYPISGLFKITIMVSGITVEFIGLILIIKEKRLTKQ